MNDILYICDISYIRNTNSIHTRSTVFVELILSDYQKFQWNVININIIRFIYLTVTSPSGSTIYIVGYKEIWYVIHVWTIMLMRCHANEHVWRTYFVMCMCRVLGILSTFKTVYNILYIYDNIQYSIISLRHELNTHSINGLRWTHSFRILIQLNLINIISWFTDSHHSWSW